MTSVNGFIDRAARRAEALPLARMVGLMLGGSTAFFCLAMPPRVIDALLGAAGLSPPIGLVGRIVFTLACALIAAGLGWLALTIVARGPRAAFAVDEQESEPTKPRKRGLDRVNLNDEAGPRPPVLAVRRGDSHPDAPPCRPIFAAQDLGTPLDEIVAEAPAEPVDADEPAIEEPELDAPSIDAPDADDYADADPVLDPILDEPRAADIAAVDDSADPTMATENEAPDEAPRDRSPTAWENAEVADVIRKASEYGAIALDVELADLAPEQREDLAAARSIPAAATPPIEDPAEDGVADAMPVPEPEPLELVHRMPADAPVAPVVPAAEEQTLASLMARLEGGLDALGNTLPPPPDISSVTPLRRPERQSDDALRDALDALQRMVARQR